MRRRCISTLFPEDVIPMMYVSHIPLKSGAAADSNAAVQKILAS